MLRPVGVAATHRHDPRRKVPLMTHSTRPDTVRSSRTTSRLFSLLIVGAVALAACGDDDDADSTVATESTAATETTAAAESGGDGDSSDGDSSGSAAPAGASGTATFSAGDLTIDGDVTACENPNETDLTMTVVGENAGFQVTSTGEGGAVAVEVTGAAEFEGTGQASVSDSGDISVTGQGSELDDDAPVVDFTITGTIQSC